MKVLQDTISRDWQVEHRGRNFLVNFTESDGQTLALVNRDNWEITEETDDGPREMTGVVLSGATKEEIRQAEDDLRIMTQLIRFCVEEWDNEFMQNIAEELHVSLVEH